MRLAVNLHTTVITIIGGIFSTVAMIGSANAHPENYPGYTHLHITSISASCRGLNVDPTDPYELFVELSGNEGWFYSDFDLGTCNPSGQVGGGWTPSTMSWNVKAASARSHENVAYEPLHFEFWEVDSILEGGFDDLIGSSSTATCLPPGCSFTYNYDGNQFRLEIQVSGRHSHSF